MVRQVALNYKLNLKYGGLFRLARNSSKMVCCFGKRKCIYIDMCSYNLSQLVEEVKKHYLSHSNDVLSILFFDKYAKEQTFIQLETSENFQLMLNMYDEEKELTIYVTKNNQMPQRCQNEIAFVPDGENGSDSDCQSENSYHSLHSSDDEHDFKSEFEVHSDMKNSPTMKVHQKFSDMVVLEIKENTNSWEWFLKLLKKAIGTPNGLVISSDMQKGLGAAITQVYPDVEHRECMRHMYSNFKKQFRGDFFKFNIWGAANTYKRRKCRRCGGYGHLQKTCKRSPSDASTSQVSPSDASTSKVPPSEPCQPPPGDE
ncbi:transposase, MuDR, MULE transposase domain protein [Tanacetum coccineum]